MDDSSPGPCEKGLRETAVGWFLCKPKAALWNGWQGAALMRESCTTLHIRAIPVSYGFVSRCSLLSCSYITGKEKQQRPEAPLQLCRPSKHNTGSDKPFSGCASHSLPLTGKCCRNIVHYTISTRLNGNVSSLKIIAESSMCQAESM